MVEEKNRQTALVSVRGNPEIHTRAPSFSETKLWKVNESSFTERGRICKRLVSEQREKSSPLLATDTHPVQLEEEEEDDDDACCCCASIKASWVGERSQRTRVGETKMAGSTD